MAKAVKVEAEVVEDGRELVVTCTPAEIEANFDALEERVRRMVADYDGATYDMSEDENVKAAKRDRMFLNGIVKQIDERRKAVKREYLRPLDAFEARCKEISGIAKGASDAIKVQLDEAERLRRERAYAALEAHYGEVADLLAPVVPYLLMSIRLSPIPPTQSRRSRQRIPAVSADVRRRFRRPGPARGPSCGRTSR